MEPMEIQQLRGVVNARIAELDAYRYMAQALDAVIEAEDRKAAAQQHVDALAKAHEEKEADLAHLEEQYAEKEMALQTRMDAMLADYQDKLKAAQDELSKKQET